MSELSLSQIPVGPPARRKGGPLALLAIVPLGWAVVGSVIWESPFVLPEVDLLLPAAFAGSSSSVQANQIKEAPLEPAVGAAGLGAFYGSAFGSRVEQVFDWRLSPALNRSAYLAVGHQQLMAQAFGVDWHSVGIRSLSENEEGMSGGSPGGLATGDPSYAFGPVGAAA